MFEFDLMSFKEHSKDGKDGKEGKDDGCFIECPEVYSDRVEQ